jgi:hypothetical protein
MSRRGRGRPAKTEREYWGEVLWLERLTEEETAALRQAGLKPKKAQTRAAAMLGISERSARRLLAQARDQTAIDWSKQPLGTFLRDLAKKNDGTDFLAAFSCGVN